MSYDDLDLDAAARETARWLLLTPVVAGEGAMKWTSPATGTSFVLHPHGAWAVACRAPGGTFVADGGHGEPASAAELLAAPHSLPTRQVAARAIIEADLVREAAAAGVAGVASYAAGTHLAAS